MHDLIPLMHYFKLKIDKCAIFFIECLLYASMNPAIKDLTVWSHSESVMLYEGFSSGIHELG